MIKAVIKVEGDGVFDFLYNIYIYILFIKYFEAFIKKMSTVPVCVGAKLYGLLLGLGS